MPQEPAGLPNDPGYRALFHESVIPSWIVDIATMGFVDVNQSAVDKYGYQRETLLAGDLRLLRPNDDLVGLQNDYRALAAAVGLHSRRHRHADGRWIEVEVSVRPFPYLGERGFLAQALDPTSLQSLQAEIARVQARLTRVLECSLDAVVSIDRESRIIEWSGESQAVFGWSREEAVGQRMHELIMPERYRAQHLEGLNRYFVTGQSRILEHRIEISALRRTGEEFPVDLRITRVDRASAFDFTAFIRDRSEPPESSDPAETL